MNVRSPDKLRFAVASLGLVLSLSCARQHKSKQPSDKSAGDSIPASGRQPGAVLGPGGATTVVPLPLPFMFKSREPFVVKAGDHVEVIGSNFPPSMTAFIGTDAVNLVVASPEALSLVLPPTERAGLSAIDVSDGTMHASISIFYEGSDSDIPVYTGDPELLCASQAFYDKSGHLSQGARPCEPAAAALPACAEDGQTACLANSDFRAADMTRVTPDHVRVGVTLAGIAGGFPSKAHPLSGAGASAAGALPQVSAGLVPGAYEYWDEAGVQHFLTVGEPSASPIVPGIQDQSFSGEQTLFKAFSVKGEPGLVPSNIHSAATLFGVRGAVEPKPANCTADGQLGCVTNGQFPAAKVDATTAFHIRAGHAVGGVDGKLKLCRNSARLTMGLYTNEPHGSYYDTADLYVDDPSTPWHEGLDVFDTIDDRNGFKAGFVIPGQSPPDRPFGDDYFCDPSDWQILSTDGRSGGALQDCDAATDACMFKDPVTRSIWTKTNPDGGGKKSWQGAILGCEALVYGDVVTGWRLPTQKEWMQAMIDGISRLSDLYPRFSATLSPNSYWSSTTSGAEFLSDPARAVQTKAFTIRGEGHAYMLEEDKGAQRGWRCVHDEIE